MYKSIKRIYPGKKTTEINDKMILSMGGTSNKNKQNQMLQTLHTYIENTKRFKRQVMMNVSETTILN